MRKSLESVLEGRATAQKTTSEMQPEKKKSFLQEWARKNDLDPVAAAVAVENARRNAVPRGRGRGQITLLAAPGVEHALIAGRAPYDLVFANILAGPLVALAPSVSAVVARGGHLIIGGVARIPARLGIRALARYSLPASPRRKIRTRPTDDAYPMRDAIQIS